MSDDTLARPLFCIVDSSLTDFVGHHYSYDHAVIAAAKSAGYDIALLAHRDAVRAFGQQLNLVPCFRRNHQTPHPWISWLPHKFRRAPNTWLAGRDFYRDMISGLRSYAILPGSFLFAPTVFRYQLHGLAGLVAAQPADGPLTVVIMLRYQAHFYNDPWTRRAFRRLEHSAAQGRRVRLATDSDRLVPDLEQLTSLPIERVPIPHTIDAAGASNPRRPGSRLRIVSLGNARDEKGFLDILEAIRILDSDRGIDDAFDFVLQASGAQPDIQLAIDEFRAQQLPYVTLLTDMLSPTAYLSHLRSAHVVLLPYWKEVYIGRTSGILAEAITAGKIVITTRDTWMADQVEEYGSGLLVEDHNPRSLAAAIRSAATGYEALASRAQARRQRYLLLHNPSALLQQIVGGTA